MACEAVVTADGNVFEETDPGTEALGSCAVGFVAAPEGAPKRHCNSDGSWSDEITRRCLRTSTRPA